ncbi:MAG TPA: FAD-binding protein [Gemmatimonadaceae bacterium]|nr:FAD-binding protein [Gemmatimonadaceae bacterium]
MTATSPTRTALASPADLRDSIREAIARRRTVRVVSGGSWLDANRPVRADTTLEVSGYEGIIEYEPGDLTLTARAGTTLDEIARTTAANGQWLALDPLGDPSRATLGATIATGSYGSLAHHFGTPRDMTLGVQFVSGTGDLVRGGGRVVKNVAGFDLTRLITGSWGTLGVLTEVTVRLRALPAVEATLLIEVGATTAELERARATLRGLPFVPLAVQLVDATARRSLGQVGTRDAFIVRLGGNEEAVRTQREQLRGVGDPRDVEPEIWRRARVIEPARAAVVRLSGLPARFAMTWQDAGRITERWPGSYRHGDPGRGVVRVVLPLADGVSETSLRAALEIPFEGTRIYERLPAALWPALAPTALRGTLDRGVKAAFDPQHLLNPGILGELQ